MAKQKINRLALALRLYESGELSTGLAAKLADQTIEQFLYEMSRHEISPFGTTVDELATEVEHALAASRVPDHAGDHAGDPPGAAAPSVP